MPPKPHWTPDEDAILRDQYPVGGVAAASAALLAARHPARSGTAIKMHALKLGLSEKCHTTPNAPAGLPGWDSLRREDVNTLRQALRGVDIVIKDVLADLQGCLRRHAMIREVLAEKLREKETQ